MNIKEIFIKMIANKAGLNDKDLKEDYKLVDDIGMDSLDIVELITEVENTFGINVYDDEIESIKTIGESLRYIEKKIST